MRNKAVNRRLPFNTELSEYGRRKLRVGTLAEQQEFERALEAALIGFMILIRAIVITALGIRDITCGGGAEGKYVRILFENRRRVRGK